jgi:hypothetical protein
MKRLLLATTLIVAPLAASQAAVILTFGQTGSGNTTTSSANAAGTSTTLSNTNTPIQITQIDANSGPLPINAFYNFSATSVGAASTTPVPNQHFSGTFTITSLPGGAGTNYLSGTFSDIVIANDTSAILSASTPNAVTFTSSVIPIGDLAPARAVSLSYSNVTPGVLGLDNTTLPTFGAAVSGTFSANTVATPEPASLAVLGVGLLGLGLVTARKRS